MKSDAVYLEHIQECIRRIEEHAAGGRDKFFQSLTLQDATLRNLQTLAESTQRLSPGLKASQPQVSWNGISGFRNVLVHNYLGVELDKVWEIIDNDLPLLKLAIAKMLSDEA
jgi:uncharacterized protein with HEPN domain